MERVRTGMVWLPTVLVFTFRPEVLPLTFAVPVFDELVESEEDTAEDVWDVVWFGVEGALRKPKIL